jgi:YidC/Oxa1 family membrane protein insertase
MGFIFNTFFYKPLLNILILLYQYLPGNDFGVAIITLTIFIRIALYPLNARVIKSQKVMAEIQPRIKEIQEKHKDDKEKQMKEVMNVYQKEKINPFSGFLSLLIQMPVLLALYRVFWKGLQPGDISANLYGFIPKIEAIKPHFLGVINLLQSTSYKIDDVVHYNFINIILVILVGIAQFVQMKMISPSAKKTKNLSQKTNDFSVLMQKQMLYFFPVLTVFILWNLPAALSVYWLTTALFSIFQQGLIFKKKQNP